MTRQLRAGKGKNGLILANGGWITYQHAICLSRSPRSDGLPYPDANPLPALVTDVQIPKIAEQATGPAVIEVSFFSPRRIGCCCMVVKPDQSTDNVVRFRPRRTRWNSRATARPPRASSSAACRRTDTGSWRIMPMSGRCGNCAARRSSRSGAGVTSRSTRSPGGICSRLGM